MKENEKNNIFRQFFNVQIILIITLALILSISSIFLSIHFETVKRDQNLQNIAQTIAKSYVLYEEAYNKEKGPELDKYLDSLKESLDNIDVISVVDKDCNRLYHSNSSLIGSKYDGNIPSFDENVNRYYAVDENGPSGPQRRAYAAIYDSEGNYIGFVMAIMLKDHILNEINRIFIAFFLITVLAIIFEVLLNKKLSKRIKKSLMGYEIDVFAAMYKMRDNILAALDEGIMAIDNEGKIEFVNEQCIKMLGLDKKALIGENVLSLNEPELNKLLKCQNRQSNISFGNKEIIMDCIPISEGDDFKGTIGILHDRKEYTQLMEDLAGTRYLVDSMRANNHDFTNKLHVILGLIQMEMYDQAASYIENISMVQRKTISKVMNAIKDSQLAALLIGKIARASELNVKFILKEESYFAPSDYKLPSEVLIKIIGNLLDNSFDAMNENRDFGQQKKLVFGIYSKPDAVLITVEDNGPGIENENIEKIFENGFSTKGTGRGTGLYQVKNIVESFNGNISVESEKGIGTSFSVVFKDVCKL